MILEQLDITHTHKKDSKANTDMNIKRRTVKVPEDNTGEYLGDFGFGVLGATPKVQSMKEKHNKLDFFKS